MSIECTLRAPAKINLGLRILGRRADGYHLLESLFVPLDLADEVRVGVELGRAPGVDFALELADAPGAETVPADDANLVVRAAARFLEAAGLRAHIRLALVKQIPTGAGLGGGSSDAGAVLRGLAALVPDAILAAELPALALELGADVPFFLEPMPAWVTGIGETISPAEDVPAFDLVLANPGEALPTAAVYAAFDASRHALTPVSPGSTMRALSAFRSDPSQLQQLLTNDLKAVAEDLCPRLIQLEAALGETGARAVGMTGSGATVFGVYSSSARARAGQERLASSSTPWSRVARSAGAGYA